MNLDIPPPSTLKVETHNQYLSPPFGPNAVSPDPIAQFKLWFANASSPLNPEQGTASSTNPAFVPKPKVQEPEAMSLATATKSGVPSTRMVLLRKVDERGFVFFTNYTSRKSQELLENPYAALCFYWREIHQQVRVVGVIEKLETKDSNEYFESRPIGSRMGAWASPQSQVISEDELVERLQEVKDRFGVTNDQEAQLPRPEFWGGWRVVPQYVLTHSLTSQV